MIRALRNSCGLLVLLVGVLAGCCLGDEAVHKALVKQFGIRGEASYEYEELQSVPAVAWAWKHLKPERVREQVLSLANSKVIQNRLLYLLLHRAYSVKSSPPARTRTWFSGARAPIPGILSFGELKDAEFDAVVVGSGPAGSVLAHQLSEAGKRTLLVDRGSLVVPGEVDTRVLPHLKEGGGAVPTVNSAILLRNGRAVGGGGTVNVDLAFSPELPFVRMAWEAWSLPAFEAERVARAYAWVEEMIGTRNPSFGEVNRNNLALWRGARKMGFSPSLYDLNTRSPARGVTLANNKLSPVSQLILPALEAGYPLQLCSDVEATKILVKDGRARGVLLREANRKDRDEVRVYAPTIICSAGTLGSATLLLRSGLGGPEVGRGILLHPSMPLVGDFSHKIDNLEGTASTVYVHTPKYPWLLFECMAAGKDYASVMLFGTAAERTGLLQGFDKLGGFGVLLIDEPRRQNRITIDDSGEPQVFYELSDRDRVRLRKGVELAVEMMLRAGAKAVYVPTTEPLLGGSDWDGHLQTLTESAPVQKLEFVPGRTVLTSAHMQGSCKMGLRPESSVVGPDFSVWGVEGLYVCDTSIFPSSVGANPMQTAYTVGKLLSETLLDSSSEVPLKFTPKG